MRRFPNADNGGPGQMARRQSIPGEGGKPANSAPDFLSVSVSSPGLLSQTSDPGESLSTTLRLSRSDVTQTCGQHVIGLFVANFFFFFFSDYLAKFGSARCAVSRCRYVCLAL